MYAIHAALVASRATGWADPGAARAPPDGEWSTWPGDDHAAL